MSDDFGLWDVIVSMFWFMLLVSWIWLLIAILGDIFRDRGLGGGAKALWTVLLVFLPWIGAVAYLIARGGSMSERSQQAAQEREAGMRSYIQSVSASGGPADELSKLAALRDSGTITEADFELAKSKILA